MTRPRGGLDGPGRHGRRYARVRDRHQRGRVRSRARRAQQPRRPDRADQPAAARRTCRPSSTRQRSTRPQTRAADRDSASRRRVASDGAADDRPAPAATTYETQRQIDTDSRPTSRSSRSVARRGRTRTVDSRDRRRCWSSVPLADRARRARGLVLRRPRAAAGRGDPRRGGGDHRLDHPPARARARRPTTRSAASRAR